MASIITGVLPDDENTNPGQMSMRISDGTRSRMKQLPILEYLYELAFVTGGMTDVTLKAFGKTYNLHRLILYRCPFFTTLLGDSWNDKDQGNEGIHEIDFSHDNSITPDAFDTALKALYGSEEYKNTTSIDGLLSLFSVANYLDFSELAEFTVKQITASIDKDNISTISQFYYNFNYGKRTIEVLNACASFLFTELITLWSSEKNLDFIADAPLPLIVEILSSDKLHVRTEYMRCKLFLSYYRLVEDRWKGEQHEEDKEELPWKAKEELEYVRAALNKGVYLANLSMNILISLGKETDINGKQMFDKKILRESLWKSQELKSIIESSSSIALEIVIPNSYKINHPNDTLYPLSSDEDEYLKWSQYPPCRFSVEFPSVAKLGPSRNSVSENFLYAGSCWNITLSKEKEGTMGVFLNRQELHQTDRTIVVSQNDEAIIGKEFSTIYDYLDPRRCINACCKIHSTSFRQPLSLPIHEYSYGNGRGKKEQELIPEPNENKPLKFTIIISLL